jgi:prepilin-type N-terminal cleavage/methylation domain-containing protein
VTVACFVKNILELGHPELVEGSVPWSFTLTDAELILRQLKMTGFFEWFLQSDRRSMGRMLPSAGALDNSSPSACDGDVPRRSVHPPGFTMLEVVLAMTIAAIVVCLSVAGYTRFIEATAIDGAAQMVNDVLTEARQDAVTQNKTVEVRLYAASGGNAYDALQLHWVDSDGTTPAAAPAVILPQAAVIDATPSHLAVVTTHLDATAAKSVEPSGRKWKQRVCALKRGSAGSAAVASR